MSRRFEDQWARYRYNNEISDQDIVKGNNYLRGECRLKRFAIQLSKVCFVIGFLWFGNAPIFFLIGPVAFIILVAIIDAMVHVTSGYDGAIMPNVL
jgi:hypothetical protein